MNGLLALDCFKKTGISCLPRPAAARGSEGGNAAAPDGGGRLKRWPHDDATVISTPANAVNRHRPERERQRDVQRADDKASLLTATFTLDVGHGSRQ
jgi:hypothetical protein